MKYYVAADVHGFTTILRETLARAGYFSDPEPHRLVLLGDCFDRGTENMKVFRFLLSVPRIVIIRGNHEDILEEVLTEKKIDETDCSEYKKSQFYN